MICVNLSLQGLNGAPTSQLSITIVCKLKRGQKSVRSDVNQAPGHQAQAVQCLRQLSSASESGSKLVSSPSQPLRWLPRSATTTGSCGTIVYKTSTMRALFLEFFRRALKSDSSNFDAMSSNLFNRIPIKARFTSGPRPCQLLQREARAELLSPNEEQETILRPFHVLDLPHELIKMIMIHVNDFLSSIYNFSCAHRSEIPFCADIQ